MERKTGKSGAGGSSKPASEQEYLATELGHVVDYEGEPAGVENPTTRRDPQFQEFTLALWREVQNTRSSNSQMREVEREGLTTGDLWAPGISEFLPTSSTPDEMRRYKQKLLFRANMLEAVLIETVAQLKSLDRVKPEDTDDDA